MTNLQLVLEAVKTLGGEGREAFIWWLWMNYVAQPVMFTLAVTVVGLVAARVLRSFFDPARELEGAWNDANRYRKVADEARVEALMWQNRVEKLESERARILRCP